MATLKKVRRLNQVLRNFLPRVDRTDDPPSDDVDYATAVAVDLTGMSLTRGVGIFIPYGQGIGRFGMRVFGWYPTDVVGGDSGSPGYHSILFAELICTLGDGLPGLAGGVVNDRNFYCSEIELIVGNQGISVEVVNANEVQGAHVVIDLKNCDFVEATFARMEADSCNSLSTFI